jgi:hypothetical protein
MEGQLNIVQEQNERYAKKLQETPISVGQPHWYFLAEKVLQHNSLLSLGVSAKDYDGLRFALMNRKLTMMQFAVLSNAIEASTPNQLGGDMHTYATDMEIVQNESVKWNEESEKLKGEVKKEIEMLLAASGADKPGLKMVRGEA